MNTLLLSLLLLGQPSSSPSQESIHSLNFTLLTNRKLNDDQSLLSQVPKPILVYRYTPPEFALTLIMAALYNRVDFNLGIAPKADFYLSSDGLITIAGDSPRVDGEGLDDFEFKAHRASASAGLLYKLGDGVRQVRLKAEYHTEFHFNYDSPNSSNFTMPKDIVDHGFALILEGSRPPPSELMDFGIRPFVYGSYRFRNKNEAWGLDSNLKDIDSYWTVAGRVNAALPISDDWVFTGRIHGSYVSEADRINAIREGSIRIGHLGILVSDLKVDRSFGGTLGVRWYCLGHRKFAISPFAHALTYREVRVDRLKTDTGFGPGINIAGQWGENFMWSLLYGSMFGNRDDINALHELQLNLTYRFIP